MDLFWKESNCYSAWHCQYLLNILVENGAHPSEYVEGQHETYKCFKNSYLNYIFDPDSDDYWGMYKGKTYLIGQPDRNFIEFHPEMFSEDSPFWKGENPTDDELLVYNSLYGEFPEILRKKT